MIHAEYKYNMKTMFKEFLTRYLNGVITIPLQPNNWGHSGDGRSVDQAIVCPSSQVSFNSNFPRGVPTIVESNPTAGSKTEKVELSGQTE